MPQAPEQRTFTLQGQVQSLDAPRKLVIVKHEEIKGFMPAMTMPYEVVDAKAMDGLAPGDLINAKLIVFSNGAHLTDIKKVGTAPLEKPPAEAPNPPTASSGFELLQTGRGRARRQVPRSGRQGDAPSLDSKARRSR